MIYCTHCGKEILADSQYCPFCGAHVDVVNKTVTEPVKTEQVVTEPMKTERVVTEPVRTERVVTEPVVTNIYKGTSGTHRHTEFFLNPGFWGSVLVLVGFFLPIKNISETNLLNSGTSLFNIVDEMGSSDPAVYLYLVFPVSALVILIQSLTHAMPAFIPIIFKILSLFFLVLFAYVIFKNPAEYNIPTNDMSALFPSIGLGVWATVIGTILMLFYKKYRRVERRIDRVDRVDEKV
jgi:hypothetical protein